MSIIGQATTRAATTQQSAVDLSTLIILALAVVSIFVAVKVGAFRRKNILGPARVADRESLGLILMLIGLAVFAYITAQTVVLVATGHTGRPTTGPTTATTTQLTEGNATTAPTAAQTFAELPPPTRALLASVPGIVLYAVIVFAHRTLRRNGLRLLGLAPSQLRPGLIIGLIGAVVMIPLVFVASILTELLWRVIGYEHPPAHELLTSMGESPSSWITFTLIAAAVAVAPMAEELLFRGHLQTLFTYLAARLRRRIDRNTFVPPAVAPADQFLGVIYRDPSGFAPPAPAASPTEHDPRYHPSVAARWVSLILTSLCFAAIHSGLWMMPPLFFFAICVGYVYERTGNLWACMVMHATFNATSTILFLTLPHVR